MATKTKKIERPLSKIEKELIIATEVAEGRTAKDISNCHDGKGITLSMVRHTIKKLEKYKTKKALDEYFKMAFAMLEIMQKNQIDPDMYLGKIMGALYVHEIDTAAKLKKMSDVNFDEFLKCMQLRCAGWKVHSTLIEYRANLRGKKIVKE